MSIVDCNYETEVIFTWPPSHLRRRKLIMTNKNIISFPCHHCRLPESSRVDLKWFPKQIFVCTIRSGSSIVYNGRHVWQEESPRFNSCISRENSCLELLRIPVSHCQQHWTQWSSTLTQYMAASCNSNILCSTRFCG